jgi:hypothetical protein
MRRLGPTLHRYQPSPNDLAGKWWCTRVDWSYSVSVRHVVGPDWLPKTAADNLLRADIVASDAHSGVGPVKCHVRISSDGAKPMPEVFVIDLISALFPVQFPCTTPIRCRTSVLIDHPPHA